MNDPLAQLLDIHLPTPPSFWPPGPLTWLVLIAISCIVSGLFWFYRHKKKLAPSNILRSKQVKKLALQELQTGYRQFQSDHKAQVFVSTLCVLLKRYALQRFDKQAVAPLSDEAWADFLWKQSRAHHFFENKQTFYALLFTQYQADDNKLEEQQVTALYEWATDFFKQKTHSKKTKGGHKDV